MSDIGKSKLKGSIKGDAERRERLASELRANLKKRKAQARMRKAGSSSDEGGSSRTDDDKSSQE